MRLNPFFNDTVFQLLLPVMFYIQVCASNINCPKIQIQVESVGSVVIIGVRVLGQIEPDTMPESYCYMFLKLVTSSLQYSEFS